MDTEKVRSYFYKEKATLKILGISFTGNESILYRMYSFILLFAVNYTYPFIAFSDLFKHDFDIMADVLDYEFASFMGMAKTTVFMLNRIKFGKILDKLQQPPFLPDKNRGGEEEENILNTCLKIATVQTITYWVLEYAAIGVAVSYTCYKRFSSSDYHDWQFTYGPITIMNVTRSPNFEILWFYQNLSLTCIGTHFVTIDLLMASVLAHISFQLKMLQNYIRISIEKTHQMMLEDNEQAAKDSRNTHGSRLIPWKYLKVTLKDIVNYHVAIINITEEVEDVFNLLLLFVSFGTMGMVCFSIYHASLLSPGDLRFTRTLLEAFAVCFQIGLISFWGEQILFESQNVSKAVFESNLIETDVKFQKGMIMVMRRSLKPIKLTAGKFSIVGLSLFTWFLKTSYSAFMVLYNSNH